MGEMKKKLDVDRTRPKKLGQDVQSGTHQGKPHFRSVSAAPSGEHESLAGAPAGHRVSLTVHDLSADGERGAAELKGRNIFEQNRALVANYLKWLGERGLNLPENPRRRGEIFFPQAEVEAGVSCNSLNLNKNHVDNSNRARLREMLDCSVTRLGLAVRVLPQRPGQEETPITFGRMLEAGKKERKLELMGRPSPAQQRYNTMAALRLFLRVLGLKDSDTVGVEFVTEFRGHVEQVAGQIKNASSRRKFQTEIYWWYRFYQRLVKEQAIPAEFHRAVAHLAGRSGLSYRLLAELIGVTPSSLKLWCEAKATPSPRSYGAVTKMEQLFKLSGGTLVNKISPAATNRHIRFPHLPGFLRENKGLASRVAPHLPADFCELPPDRQKEIVRSIENDILRSNDPHTENIMELRKLPYSLREWPARLEEEFDDLAAFMTGDRPPLGMKRNDRWRLTTKSKVRRDLTFFFGAVSLPPDSEDKRLRGLGVSAGNLSLALIACPLVLDWYIRFKASRTQYTSYMTSQLEIFRAMLRPGTGWVRQQPRLATRLCPINAGGTQLVSRELIQRAQADWDAVCDEARGYYKHLINELGPLISVARNPFYRIQGILSMRAPLDVFKRVADGMKSDLPNRVTQPRRYHTAVRDRTLMLLFALTGFRLRTMSQLNYTGDERGHLFPQKKGYELRVPRALFKEEESPFFGSPGAWTDYVMRLRNVYGLNELLREYLNVSRPWLMAHVHPGCTETPLFPSSAAHGSVRPGAPALHQVYRKAFAKYLVENKWRGTGIPGVKVTGPHSARHIRATDVIKKTGSFQLAADSIHNSEKMAKKHYARFTTTDRNEHVNETLFGRIKNSTGGADEGEEEEEKEEEKEEEEGS